MPPQLGDRDAAVPWEPKAHVFVTFWPQQTWCSLQPSSKGYKTQAETCGDHPAPHALCGQSPEASSRRWPKETHTWRHTHASTYSNLLKIGLSPCKEGASSRLRENSG